MVLSFIIYVGHMLCMVILYSLFSASIRPCNKGAIYENSFQFFLFYYSWIS